MTGHTTKGYPYALGTDALTDWPATSLELATKLEARASVVTSLPASPADGDEVYYVPASGLAIWRLRYRAASTSAYKWECIGGIPLYQTQPGTPTNVATGTWTNLMPGLISLPLAGEYECSAGGVLQAGAAACTMNCSLYVGTLASPVGLQSSGTLPAGGYTQAFTLPAQSVLVAAGAGVGVAGMSNIASCLWKAIGQRVMPVRVS